MSLLATLSLSSCASVHIPDVPVYKEIPFVDGPEGVSVNTVSKADKLYSAQEWAAIQPVLLCVDDKGWAEIKKGWLMACRYAGSKKCDVQVQSVSKIVEELDAIAKKVYQVIPK